MDIAKYLKHINMPGDLLHRLECDYKEGKGYRLFKCDFFKEIFWSAISKDSPVCIFKCKVTPSQRTSSSPHNVWVIVQKKNPGGEIKSVYCSRTAGLLGFYNHVIAMLFRIETAVSMGITKPSCTSQRIHGIY